MKIQALNIKNISKPHNFRSIYYQKYTYKDYETEVLRETQNTTGERHDLDYMETARLVEKRFHDFDRVNIMPMNVSDGTEAYFLGGAIIRNEGLETFQKRYKSIFSTDICSDVIDKFGRRGIVFLDKPEEHMLNNFLPNFVQQVAPEDVPQDVMKYNNFMTETLPYITVHYDLYELLPKYRNCFEFGTMDFRKRMDNYTDKGNSVFIVRNCMKQSFGDSYTKNILIPKFAQNIKDASLLIIGDFDRTRIWYNGESLAEMLKGAGFTELIHNVFGRKDFVPKTNIFKKMHK